MADEAVAVSWRRTPVRYSPEVAKALCERVAAGELLYAVCREEGMPTPAGVAKWLKERPDFAEAFSEARLAGGRPAGVRGPVYSYCPATADAIFERVCEGESYSAIGRDPTMPSLSTIFYWRRRIAEFETAMQLAKDIQAERFCDMSWELAQGLTPETAYATDVKLKHIRWMAGVMSPKVYRLKPAEPEKAREALTVLIRRFEIEEDPETGEKIVVAYCPNPETGEVECERQPGWRRLDRPGVVSLPAGGGPLTAQERARGRLGL